MRPLPRVPSRLAHPLRRAAAALCLLLAFGSWLDGPRRAPAASPGDVTLSAGERATSVPVFADVTRVVHPGDLVDLVAPDAPGDNMPGERLIAQRVRVLAVHRADSGFGSTDDVADLVVATSPATAVQIARSLRRGPFAVILGSS